jgi:ribosomal protein L37AE/L43A
MATAVARALALGPHHVVDGSGDRMSGGAALEQEVLVTPGPKSSEDAGEELRMCARACALLERMSADGMRATLRDLMQCSATHQSHTHTKRLVAASVARVVLETADGKGFRMGDRVEVLFDVAGGRSKFYAGSVTHLVSTGLYTIAFDDGETKDCWDDDMRLPLHRDDSSTAVDGASKAARQPTTSTPNIALCAECCICKDAFEGMELDTRICQLPCKHAMCAACIEAWFGTSELGKDENGKAIHSRKTCPQCRRCFASLRKSNTATLAEIVALQHRSDADSTQKLPILPRQGLKSTAAPDAKRSSTSTRSMRKVRKRPNNDAPRRNSENVNCPCCSRKIMAPAVAQMLRCPACHTVIRSDQHSQRKKQRPNCDAVPRSFAAGEKIDCPSCTRKIMAPVEAKILRCPACREVISSEGFARESGHR